MTNEAPAIPRATHGLSTAHYDEAGTERQINLSRLVDGNYRLSVSNRPTGTTAAAKTVMYLTPIAFGLLCGVIGRAMDVGLDPLEAPDVPA